MARGISLTRHNGLAWDAEILSAVGVAVLAGGDQAD